MHERLAGVVIERMPFAHLLRRYDTPATLFYLDPPYWGCEDDYGPVFAREDFGALAEALGGLKGDFLMSTNDTPEVRRTFASFGMEGVRTTYTVGGSRSVAGNASELLIAKQGSRLLAEPFR